MRSQIFYNADGASSGGGTAVASAPAPVSEAPKSTSITSPAPNPTDIAPAHWSHSYDGLEDGIKGHSALLPFKTPADAVKAYVKVQPMLGAEKVAIPKDWTNIDEVNQFAAKMGRPEEAKGYDIGEVQLPEGFALDSKMVDNFKDMAHKYALSPWQVQNLVKDYTKLQTDNTLKEHAQIQNERQSRLAEYERSLGSTIKFEENMALSRHALETYGDAELRQIIEDNGLNQEPSFIRAFARMGMDVKEGRAHNTPAQNAVFNSGTPDGATQKIAELKLDPEFMKAFQTAHHAGHREAVEMWQKLHTIQSRK